MRKGPFHMTKNHPAADCSGSFLGLHEERGSKHVILIGRVLRHFLTGFPLLDNLVVLEAKDVDQRDPRTTRREPNSPVNCDQISVFQSAQPFKFLLGKCAPISLHPSEQPCPFTRPLSLLMT